MKLRIQRLALIAGAVFFALVFFYMSQRVSPFLLPTHLFLAQRFDDTAFVAQKLAKISDENKVVLAGSSSLREAILLMDGHLVLNSKNAVNASYSSQTLLDSLNVCESLGAGGTHSRKVFALGVNVHRSIFDMGEIYQREVANLPIRQFYEVSDGQLTEKLDLRRYDAVLFVEQIRKRFDKYLENIEKTPPIEINLNPAYAYDSRSPLSKLELEKTGKLVQLSYLRRHKSSIERVKNAILRIGECTKEKGFMLAAVEMPIHPIFGDRYPEILNEYRDQMRIQLKNLGIPYFQFEDSSEAPLLESDFYDLVHLRPSGRSRYSKALDSWLSSQLNGTVQ